MTCSPSLLPSAAASLALTCLSFSQPGVRRAQEAWDGCALAWPRSSVTWGKLGTLGWASRRCSHSDSLASPAPQSYCLKVKEMDDEEYSCIVSVTGLRGTQSRGQKAWGV